MNPRKLKTAWVDTQVGRLTLVYEDAPLLVKRILLPGEEKNPSDGAPSLADEGCPAPAALSRMVIDHLNGVQIQPPWDILSREGITPLQQAVYVQTAAIPYGSLASYREIAERIGRPKACRFVGSALAKNPFPILIPCHRVIRSDNKLGGFGGGLALKQLLIDFEARRA
ncbi:MAG: methylated-DNA--[protein]-cysteine S-methyltransferase [Desulfosalsimonadaceae bacterium]|nr:methylated-DNA--[protein]-cysteine S-methyltransferase [Desulfosalsimonadaceae bacterium]